MARRGSAADRQLLAMAARENGRLQYKAHFYGSTCPECHGVGRKFPRSSHLANLGAATHDDLLLSTDVRQLFVGHWSYR